MPWVASPARVADTPEPATDGRLAKGGARPRISRDGARRSLFSGGSQDNLLKTDVDGRFFELIKRFLG
jgi:hypothetical protein